MKKIISLLIVLTFISCKKDQENVNTNSEINTNVVFPVDSAAVPSIDDPMLSGPFKIIPQDIQAKKGRTVFVQNGNTLFYFDQNANRGIVKIDGKEYTLDRFDFNENNYTIQGAEVKIEASNGDFKEMVSDCVYGTFPDVKITVGDKTLNLANINVQDCPVY